MFRILCDPSSGSVERAFWTCGVCAWCDSSHQAHTPQIQKITLPNTDYAQKNITSNFSQERSTFPEDGSQKDPKHVGVFNCLLKH